MHLDHVWVVKLLQDSYLSLDSLFLHLVIKLELLIDFKCVLIIGMLMVNKPNCGVSSLSYLFAYDVVVQRWGLSILSKH